MKYYEVLKDERIAQEYHDSRRPKTPSLTSLEPLVEREVNHKALVPSHDPHITFYTTFERWGKTLILLSIFRLALVKFLHQHLLIITQE